MKFDDAKIRWAGDRLRTLGIEPPYEVTRVEFDMCHNDGGCPTCDYGSETYIDVTIVYTDITAKIQKKQHRKVKSFKVDNFSALLRELFEVTE